MRLCTLHNYYAPVWLPETCKIMHPAQLLCTRMATGNWWDYAPCTIVMHPYCYRKLLRLCTLHNYYAPVWLPEIDEIMQPAQLLCTRMATGNWWDYAPCTIIMHSYGYRKLMRLCTLHNYYAPVWLPEICKIVHPAQLLCTRMATGNWWDYAPCTIVMHPYCYRKLMRLCTLHNYYAPVWLPETDEIMHPAQSLCTRMATRNWWDYAPCTIIIHPYGYRKLMRLCTLHNYYAPVWLPETDEIMHPAQLLCTRMATGKWWDYAPCTIVMHPYCYRKLMRICTPHNYYAPVWLPETDEIMHPAQLLCTRMASGNWWDYAPCTIIMHPYGYRKLMRLCTLHNCYTPVWLPETCKIMHPAQVLCTRMATGNWWDYAPCTIIMHPYGYRKLVRLWTLHNYYALVWLPETDEIMHPAQLLCTRIATGIWWDYAPCTIIMHPYGYRKLMRLCTLHNYYAPVWLPETCKIMHPAQLLCTPMATGNWWDYAPCTIVMHPYCYRKLMRLCTLHNYYAPVWLPETDEIMHPAQLLCTRMATRNWWDYAPCTIIIHPYGYRKLMRLCTLNHYYAPVWLPETDEIMQAAQLLCTRMATENWWDYAPCTIIMHPYGYRKLMRVCTLHNYYAPV